MVELPVEVRLVPRVAKPRCSPGPVQILKPKTRRGMFGADRINRGRAYLRGRVVEEVPTTMCIVSVLRFIGLSEGFFREDVREADARTDPGLPPYRGVVHWTRRRGD